MASRNSGPRLILTLAMLLVLSLGATLPAQADQPVNAWLGHLVDRLIASMPWTPAPAAKATAKNNTFPNMDPNGLEDFSGTETYPDMDPNGLEDSTEGETFPNMDPNG